MTDPLTIRDLQKQLEEERAENQRLREHCELMEQLALAGRDQLTYINNEGVKEHREAFSQGWMHAKASALGMLLSDFTDEKRERMRPFANRVYDEWQSQARIASLAAVGRK